jgi:flavodoxin
MKAMVVYDSAYGNTKAIASAIAGALGPPDEVQLRQVGEVKPEELAALDLLVVGSPTQRFTAIPPITNLLKSIPPGGLRGVKVAAFDTRFPQAKIDEIRILSFFVSLFGYAAKPIANRLVKKGGELVAPPEGFFVSDTKGPLLDGELERAAAWGQAIAIS